MKGEFTLIQSDSYDNFFIFQVDLAEIKIARRCCVEYVFFNTKTEKEYGETFFLDNYLETPLCELLLKSLNNEIYKHKDLDKYVLDEITQKCLNEVLVVMQGA